VWTGGANVEKRSSVDRA